MKTIKEPASSTAAPPRDLENEAELSGRDRYLLEAQRIRDEIGDLPQILEALGINQRRACQLLLVDPSAWTRWNKTGAPPHIYQALRWLLELKKTKPSITGPIDMGQRLDRIQLTTQTKLKELEQGLAMVERALTFTPAANTESSETVHALQAATAMQKALLEERRENLKVISELEGKIRNLSLRQKTTTPQQQKKKAEKKASKKPRLEKKPQKKKAGRKKTGKKVRKVSRKNSAKKRVVLKRTGKQPDPKQRSAKKKKALAKMRRPPKRSR